MKLRRFLACASTVVLAAPSAQALTINLINTGGVEQGSQAYAGFAAAAACWESVLTDNVTLNINVGFTTAGFSSPSVLGQAASASGSKTQAAWRCALIGDATTPLDAIATAHLATFSNANVNLNTALQKALGLYTGTASAIDATITFNSARPFDLDTRDGFTGVSSDFVSVAAHEIGHALGFTSAVGQNSTNNSRPSNTDMFRYQNGSFSMLWGGIRTSPSTAAPPRCSAAPTSRPAATASRPRTGRRPCACMTASAAPCRRCRSASWIRPAACARKAS